MTRQSASHREDLIALLYRRVSTEDQARDGVSLAFQASQTREYASRRGWTIGGEFEDILAGTRVERPRYQALLVEARRLHREGRTVAVAVTRLDRFGRSVFERARCAEELRRLGVRLHSINEGGEVPELVAHILAAVAEEEVRRQGERMIQARAFVAAGGWHYPTRAAWGYVRRVATPAERAQGAPHSVLAIDQKTARYVRRAYRMAEAGESVHAIARWVQQLPPEVRGHRRMSYPMVRQMLHAAVYVARQAQGDSDVLARPIGRWPALVSDEQWRRVQQRLAHRPVPSGVWVRRYLLTGLIRCPRCGARMGGNRNFVSTLPWCRRPRYTCIGRHIGAGRDTSCHESAIMPVVDESVVAQVTNLLDAALSANRNSAAARRERATAAARDVRDRSGSDGSDDRRELMARQRWTDAAMRLVDGRIRKATYDRARAAAVAQLRVSAERRQVRTAASDGAVPPRADILRLARDWADALASGDVSAQRRVLEQLITRATPVRVRRGEYLVEIDWTPLGQALQVGGA